jgi:hypothetical protein
MVSRERLLLKQEATHAAMREANSRATLWSDPFGTGMASRRVMSWRGVMVWVVRGDEDRTHH